MELTLEAFRAIEWQGNSFEIVERDAACISFLVNQLAIDGKPPHAVRFAFPRPGSERAGLWDASAKSWAKHPDPHAPIGPVIVEAHAKPVPAGVMVSFAGHHALGWSRWGFTAERILVIRVA
jgi:hypothetical protein